MTFGQACRDAIELDFLTRLGDLAVAEQAAREYLAGVPAAFLHWFQK